jgi:hypothetical protein
MKLFYYVQIEIISIFEVLGCHVNQNQIWYVKKKGN